MPGKHSEVSPCVVTVNRLTCGLTFNSPNVAYGNLTCSSSFIQGIILGCVRGNFSIVIPQIVCAGFVATNLTIKITIPTQSDRVPVMSVFGWIIIHQHLGSTFDWQLPWADYKAGFGSIDADFWLGLEKVHLLTSSQPYRLRVEVQERSTDLWYSVEYWSFKIGDELNTKYRLEVSGYSGDAGDSLQYKDDLNGNGNYGFYYHNGMQFSTYDQDNDLSSAGNCAAGRGGGWWFNSCFWACLTCAQSYSEWGSLSEVYADNSRMMIKPQ